MIFNIHEDEFNLHNGAWLMCHLEIQGSFTIFARKINQNYEILSKTLGGKKDAN